MRLPVTAFALITGFSLLAGPAAGSALFEAFYEQRELLASIQVAPDAREFDGVVATGLEPVLSRIRDVDADDRLIRIEGFPGRDGVEEDFRVSLHRANMVARFLEQKGIACLVGISEDGLRRAGPAVPGGGARVEVASYPRMLLLDDDVFVRVNLDEVK